ncbi:MAG: 50S ribosomal protein L15 [bacterium]
MVTGFHNLRKPKDRRTAKNKKRVGRGNASRGTTSGRGTKGQKARAGASQRPGFEGGRTTVIQQLPKLRGFKSISKKVQNINIYDLENKFATGDVVDIKVLKKSGLIKKTNKLVKILGAGQLTKKLTVYAHQASTQAIKKITQAKGEFKKITIKELPQKDGSTDSLQKDLEQAPKKVK